MTIMLDIEQRSAKLLNVEEIIRATHGIGVDSTNRLDKFLQIAAMAEPAVFWPAFQRVWPGCDDTWRWRKDLHRVLTSKAPSYLYLEGGDLEFWNSLPELVPIFRGCDWVRKWGMSWTTNRKVADEFARGHRGLRNGWPVVLEGTIRKRSILSVCTNREEFEILVRPRAVRKAFFHRTFEFDADHEGTQEIEEPVTIP